MALTEAQIEKAIDYVVKKMIEEHANVVDVTAVMRWMILNPLPTKEEYQAQVAAWDEEAKQKRILRLRAELDKLEE